MSKQPRNEDLWVVVRVDLYDNKVDLDRASTVITIKEALPTSEEANAEAARLNEVNDDKSCHYYVAWTRFYPDGRNVEVG